MSDMPKIRFKQFDSEWDLQSLSDIATMHARIGWQNLRTSEYLEHGDYMLITGTDFDDGRIIFDTCNYVAKERYDQDKNIQIADGNILITKDGTLGKVAYVEGLSKPATLNAGIFNVVIREPAAVDAKYLFQYLKAPFLMEYVSKNATGGTIKHLNQSILKSFPIDLPEKEEQEKIGYFLGQIDDLIHFHQRTLSKAKETKLFFLDSLFASKNITIPSVRFGAWKNEWVLLPLNKVLSPFKDYLPTPTDGYTRLGIRSHMKGTFYEYVAPSKRLGEKRLQRVKRDNFIVNIVFAWEHAIAVTTEEDEGKLVSHRFPQFSFNDGMHPRFFHYALNDERFRHHLWLASPSGAGRNKTLRIDEMLEYELRVPEYEEQKKIADFLTSLDELIKLYDYRITKLQNIKSACLQGMFV